MFTVPFMICALRLIKLLNKRSGLKASGKETGRWLRFQHWEFFHFSVVDPNLSRFMSSFLRQNLNQETQDAFAIFMPFRGRHNFQSSFVIFVIITDSKMTIVGEFVQQLFIIIPGSKMSALPTNIFQMASMYSAICEVNEARQITSLIPVDELIASLK